MYVEQPSRKYLVISLVDEYLPARIFQITTL